MKLKIALVVIFFLSFSLFGRESYKISVTITNLNPQTGTVKVALCNSKVNFSKKGKPFKSKETKVSGPAVILVFDGITTGEYALKVIHDENGNGEFDSNMVGIPKEGFGFSNNVMGKMGPPSFDAAKFQVKADTVVSIKIRKI